MITLQPIAMIIPTRACIYAPSRLRQTRQVTRGELTRFTRKPVMVSFEADGRSRPQMVTAYGRRWAGWWIVKGENEQ